jgi:hypothetical protein
LHQGMVFGVRGLLLLLLLLLLKILLITTYTLL